MTGNDSLKKVKLYHVYAVGAMARVEELEGFVSEIGKEYFIKGGSLIPIMLNHCYYPSIHNTMAHGVYSKTLKESIDVFATNVSYELEKLKRQVVVAEELLKELDKYDYKQRVEE